MTRPEKENLEKLLSAHLNRALNGQTGRAGAAFAKIAAEEQASAAKKRRAMMLWAGVPSAMAACVAVAIGVLALHGRGDAVGGLTQARGPVVTPQVDQMTLTRNVDGGTAVLTDEGRDLPVQVIRHQELHRMQWVDPGDRAVYRVEQPVEKVDYVRIQPY